MIVEVPGTKEGNDKELCRLHKFCSQHLWVLKTMGYDSSGPFVMSLIKMKLNRSMTFEWQRNTQKSSDVPCDMKILEFIDWQARASEAVFHESPKHYSQPQPNKNSTQIGTVYVADVDTACMLCGVGKHPLLVVCRKLRSVSPEQCMNLLWECQFCFSCLQSSHFALQCAFDHKCQKC